jgi:hypothetical protein
MLGGVARSNVVASIDGGYGLELDVTRGSVDGDTRPPNHRPDRRSLEGINPPSMSGAIDLGLDPRIPTSGATPKRPERRSGIMHGRTEDPERTRAMHGFDPKHPGRRFVAGTAAYVGILAGGLLATSHSTVTAISVVIVGGTVWRVRRPIY